MKDSNTRSIYVKYKDMIHNRINGCIDAFDNAISSMEDKAFSDVVRLKIDKLDTVKKSTIDTYFASLFDADNPDTFDLALNHIVDYIERNRVKTQIVGAGSGLDKRVDYHAVEHYLTDRLAFLMEALNLCPEDPFHYLLAPAPFINATDGMKKRDTSLYEHVDDFPVLSEKASRLLSTLSEVVKTFGLLSVQDVNFHRGRYTALEDAFETSRTIRSVKTNIGTVLRLLDEAERTTDLHDILSDSYINYVLTVLESAYFVCMFYVEESTDLVVSVQHADATAFLGNLRDNITYYLDYIDAHYDIDFIALYPSCVQEVKKLENAKLVDGLLATAVGH